jgi:hypothetical protein
MCEGRAFQAEGKVHAKIPNARTHVAEVVNERENEVKEPRGRYYIL